MTVALAGTPVGSYSGSVTKNSVTAGNLLIFMVCGSEGSSASPTSSPSVTWNTFTNNSQFSGGIGQPGVIVFYGYAPSSGNYTVTAHSDFADVGCQLWEFSGAATSDPIETAGVVYTTWAEQPSVYLSNVSATSLILGFFNEEQGSIGTVDTRDGFTVSVLSEDHIDVGVYAPPGTFSGEVTVKVGWYNTSFQRCTYESTGVALAIKVAPSATAPTVTDSAPSSITASSATGNGNVTSDGGATVTERGVCWGTSASPVRTGNHATASGTTGAFSASMSGLSASTLYYWRMYAVNSVGTTYSTGGSFATDAGNVTGAAGSVSGAHAAVTSDTPTTGAVGSRSGAHASVSGESPASGAAGSKSGASGVATWRLDASGSCGSRSGAHAAVASDTPTTGAAGGTSGASGAVASESPAQGAAGSVSGTQGVVASDTPASGASGSASGAFGSVLVDSPANGAAGSVSGAVGAATWLCVVSGSIGSVSGADGATTSESPASGATGSVSGASGSIVLTLSATGATGSLSGGNGAVTSSTPATGATGSASGAQGTAFAPLNASGAAGSLSGAQGVATSDRHAQGASGGVSGCNGSAACESPAFGSCGSLSGALGWATSDSPASGTGGSLSACDGFVTIWREPRKRPISATATIIRPASSATAVRHPASATATIIRPAASATETRATIRGVTAIRPTVRGESNVEN